MSNTKETKKVNFAPFLIAAFLFIRAFLLTEKTKIGFKNLYTLETDFSNENIVLLVLFLLLAVLASVVISVLGKKFGEPVSYLCVLFIAEPLFFAKQADCICLFITVLALLFVLNALKDKPIIPNEITLIVFLLSATILEENAIFLFAAPAIMFYLLNGVENIFSSMRKIVTLILSFICVGVGMYLNKFLTTQYPAFESFIKTYSFHKDVYFKHLEYENVFLLIFLIPTIVFGVYFFVNMIENKKERSTDKNKKEEGIVAAKAPFITLGIVCVAYILSIIGFILGGSQLFYTVNYIIPVAIIALFNSGNADAEKALNQVNNFIQKHSLIFVVVLALVCYLSARVFYSEIDNVARFILMY